MLLGLWRSRQWPRQDSIGIQPTSENCTSRPKDVNESHAVLALIHVKVQTLVRVGLLLFAVKCDGKVPLFITEGTGDTPHFQLIALVTHAFAEFPPAIDHDVSRLTLR